MSNEQEIEQMIRDKGLNAPRVTPEVIDSVIVSSQFYVFPGTTVTVCLITLKNGFSVTGESAAASIENFDKAVGERVAYDNARRKIWLLEGYRLKQDLYKIELLRKTKPE